MEKQKAVKMLVDRMFKAYQSTEGLSKQERSDAIDDVFILSRKELPEYDAMEYSALWSKAADEFLIKGGAAILSKKENGAEAIMSVLHEAGCDDIKVTQVIDHEAGVIALYGSEMATGRIFACIAYEVSAYLMTAAEAHARRLYADFLDWIDAGRPRWYEMGAKK